METIIRHEGLSIAILGYTGEKGEEERELLKTIVEIHKECAKIETEVVKIRNILSHVKPSEDDPNVLKSTIKKFGSTKIDNKWCILTRLNLIKHSENLDKLLKHC